MADSIVKTSTGKVRGVESEGVTRFLGIPYAAPPVGDLRFVEPQPHAAWDGEFDATKSGPCAPQMSGEFPGLDVEKLLGKGWERGDDYLTVNIWAPPGKAQGLPVMLFIHGGGFLAGSNNVPLSDGSAFARSGVICMAINYRMGVDGFLPIPGVPTNLGLRDQIAALKWVQENAAAFGGDPANVTVFGESAGAMSIANLIASPLAKGLFKRAIIESGHGGMTRDIGVAQKLVKKLAKLMKVAPTKEGFASVGPEDSFKAIEKLAKPLGIDLRDSEKREPVFGISRFIPVHGDDVLPERPLDALRKGVGKEVEVLIGTNAEEMNLYLVATGARDKLGRLMSTFLLHRSHPKATATLKAYGMGRGKKAGYALTDAMNDLVFRWPARRFAEEHQGRTHMYEFEWKSTAFDGTLGACHAVELPFVFNTLDLATGPRGFLGESAPQELADRVHGIWVQYATDGSLPWSEFSRDNRKVYQLEAGAAINEPVMPAAPFLP